MRASIPTTLSTRREWLARLGKTILISPLLGSGLLSISCGDSKSNEISGAKELDDDAFLDTIERAIFLYFWEQASSTTGQVKDRARANGIDSLTISSIAATGFGLTALCIADQRGYMSRSAILDRVQTTLNFLLNEMPSHYGFFYHFVDINSGQRIDRSELSSIDTAILLCGVLTCRPGSAGHGPGDGALSTHRLAVDAQQWIHILHGLDA